MTVNAIVDSAIRNVMTSNPSLLAGVNKVTLNTLLSEAITAAIPVELDLSRVSPDYESVLLQLSSTLGANSAWYDTIPAATGQALLRMIASGIAYGQFSIERALQETFIQHASADSSIYAATEMLGVRIKRVVPAKVAVVINRLDSDQYLEIPRFSRFIINDVPFFNRAILSFSPNTISINADLYQGVVNTTKLKANGEDNFEFEVGVGSKDISDTDVYVSVNGFMWERSEDRPWSFQRNETKWLDTTAPNGNVKIRFGDGIYGKVPTAGSSIEVNWVQTLGEQAHNAVAQADLTYGGVSLNTILTGHSLGPVSGARDMDTAEFYVQNAPHIRASNDRAVRKSDYRTIALQFPGIKDALFRGQSELGPKRRSMMNVVGVTLLTETGLVTDYLWDAFVAHMQERGIFQVEYIRLDPVQVNVALIANIYCVPGARLSEVQERLKLGIAELFKFKPGYLGYSIYLSDLSDTLEGMGVLGGIVDYIKIVQPIVDIVMPSKYAYANLESVVLNMHYSERTSYAGRLDIENV